MDEKQKEYAEVIFKRQKRKKLTLNVGITAMLSFISCIILASHNDSSAISIIMILTFLITFIWLIVLIVCNIVDCIKNGFDISLYLKLNEEGKRILKEKENKPKVAWYKKINVETGCSLAFIGLFLIILLLVILLLTRCTGKENNNSREFSKADYIGLAQATCQKELKARAIYPSSVKIKYRQDNYIKDNSYTIYGTVDCQNAFGAMVQQNFACEVIIDEENDKYWVNDLNIE